MNYNALCGPGKQPYQSPVSQDYVLQTEGFLCESGMGGATEEWEEIDLSAL